MEIAGNLKVNGLLIVNNQIIDNILTVTSNTVLDNTNFYIRVDTTSGNISITLPSAASNLKKIYKIKKISTSNTVTINAASGETIDGSASKSLINKEFVEIIAGSASNWDIN